MSSSSDTHRSKHDDLISERLQVLVIGCGGREHAIVKALARSKLKPRIYCTGVYRNPGIYGLVEAYATLTPGKNIVPSIVEFACKMQIDFAIVGGETELNMGIVDALDEHNIPCIGPHKALARLETSKVYCRKLLRKYGLDKYSPLWKSWSPPPVTDIPDMLDNIAKNRVTTEAINQEFKTRHFSNIENEVRQFMNELTGQFVIKADGLKGGKGVFVSQDHFQTVEEGLLLCQELYNNKDTFIIEEKLTGEEFSLLSFCDGKITNELSIRIKDRTPEVWEAFALPTGECHF